MSSNRARGTATRRSGLTFQQAMTSLRDGDISAADASAIRREVDAGHFDAGQLRNLQSQAEDTFRSHRSDPQARAWGNGNLVGGRVVDEGYAALQQLQSPARQPAATPRAAARAAASPPPRSEAEAAMDATLRHLVTQEQGQRDTQVGREFRAFRYPSLRNAIPASHLDTSGAPRHDSPFYVAFQHSGARRFRALEQAFRQVGNPRAAGYAAQEAETLESAQRRMQQERARTISTPLPAAAPSPREVSADQLAGAPSLQAQYAGRGGYNRLRLRVTDPDSGRYTHVTLTSNGSGVGDPAYDRLVFQKAMELVRAGDSHGMAPSLPR